ncbi:MAG: hypothetical protein J3R72DRAFT_452017 [Linnemannia gamsii]|nr:MAG: hypothetical protein J3R72DRAFT_452017 [Linnemannia gamsii]
MKSHLLDLKKKISNTSSQADKYEALMQPFKDPDDVEKLLEQVIDPNVEGECSNLDSSSSASDESDADGNEDDERGSTRFSALRFKHDYSNQRNIFLACRFLSGRLPDLMFPDDDSGEKFSIARESKGFSALAKELGRQEPTLHGVTGVALWSMYNRLLKAYGKLDQVSEVETGGRFEHSRLSEIVKSIFDLDRDYASKRKQVSADKEQERRRILSEQDAMNNEAIRDSMLSLGARQAQKRKERDEAAASSTSSPSTSVSTLPQSTSSRPLVNSVTIAIPSRPLTESFSKALSDMQQNLLFAIQTSSNKYDGLVTNLDSLKAQFSEFAKKNNQEELEDSLRRLQQAVNKVKSTLDDLRDEMEDMRREVRVVKRKNESIERTIEEIQMDVQELKKRK